MQFCTLAYISVAEIHRMELKDIYIHNFDTYYQSTRTLGGGEEACFYGFFKRIPELWEPVM